MAPRSGLLGPNLTRLPGPPPGVLALTFDDGPDPDVTPRVLALLEQAGARGHVLLHRAPGAAAPRAGGGDPRPRPRHREPHVQPPSGIRARAVRRLARRGAARPGRLWPPPGPPCRASSGPPRACRTRGSRRARGGGLSLSRGPGAASTRSPATRASWPGGSCGIWRRRHSAHARRPLRPHRQRRPGRARRPAAGARPDGRARPAVEGAWRPAAGAGRTTAPAAG